MQNILNGKFRNYTVNRNKRYVDLVKWDMLTLIIRIRKKTYINKYVYWYL